ncbi:MAG: RluA family pseudouridine synthase [Mycoplasmataceae bacterium]|nr:RluA family pseudouridine synthase [Mycoplasmataceae bacterium]
MSNIKTTIEVQSADRIDRYLGENSKFSRSDIKKLIEGHSVFSNGVQVRKPNFKVKPGDKILITDIIQKEIKAIPQDIPIDVVYEDDDLIIINKKTGMVVHPAPGHHDGTLVNALLFRFKDLSNINGQVRPGIVHRIDKDTSGLLVVAKNNDAHRFLADQLKEHDIKRTYLALVQGRVTNQITHIKVPIGRSQNNRQSMTVTRLNAKDAITHVFIEKLFEKQTLVRCELETGRTHQIRVHLKYIKHPIIGDPLYGTRIDDFGQRLHAYKLELTHPTTKKLMTFEAPIPEEFGL